MPALNVTHEEIDTMCETLHEVLAEQRSAG
jgi:hypothetical protein